MSLSNSARIGIAYVGGALICLLAITPALANAPRDSDSNRNATPAKSAEISATKTQSITKREPIPYSTQRKATSQLRSGTSKTVKAGVNGERVVVYKITLATDGSELRREKISEKVSTQPVNEVIEMGKRSNVTLASRGYFSGRRVVTMVPTTYDPYHCGGDGQGITCTGLKAHYGIAAVDPRFIPLGTRLYIEGYGYAVAADTGGAIKGNRIDLCIDNNRQAKGIESFRPVKVHILD